MGDLFAARVRKLSWRLRRRRAWRGACAGAFFGILPGILVALLDGSLRFPFPVAALTGSLAGICMAVGAVLGLLRGVDTRGMLVEADRLLSSHELSSTAYELAARESAGPFAHAVIADAAELLSRGNAAATLGPHRLRLLPYLPIAAAILVGALLFPFDLRPLFATRHADAAELVQLGEDLQSFGEKLLDTARPDSSRSLALSEQLTQLGKDLSDRTLNGDEALDRISRMEEMVGREFELRMQEVLTPDVSGLPATGSTDQGPQGTTEGRTPTEQSGQTAQPDQHSADTADAETDGRLKDLSDLQKALSAARRKLQEGSSESASGTTPGSGTGSPGSGDVTGTGDATAQAESPAGSGPSGQGGGPETESGASGQLPGTSPSSARPGPQTAIADGQARAPVKESIPVGEGDSARTLVRSLPDATGARLPEQTVLNDYARQAESALAHDEIPLKLRQYVKDYFTVIGMTQAGTGQ